MRISDWSSDVCSPDLKIREIVAECNSDEEPTLYLTGDEKLLYHVNRARIRGDEEALVFKPNFRHGVAKTRSEEHTSELQSLMRISYAVFCLKKKTNTTKIHNTKQTRKI